MDMGFFHARNTIAKSKTKKQLPIEFYHENSCKVCSLRKAGAKMLPSGSETPILYIIGDFPSSKDISKDHHFADAPTKLLRDTLETYFGRVPDRDCSDKHFPVRFNNVLRCNLPDDKQISQLEMECCRNFLIEDIEKTKPLFIIGIGETPLKWMLNVVGLNELWRGRIIPISIGKHKTWFMPIVSPVFVKSKDKGFGDNEWEQCFRLDIKNVKEFLMKDPVVVSEPPVVTTGHFDNIELIEGKDYRRDIEKVKKALQRLKDKEVGFDIENWPLKPWDDRDKKLLSVAIGDEEYTVSYPLEREDAWEGKYNEILDLTKQFILNSGVKIAHTLKHELTWLNEYFGQEVLRETEWADVKTQAYVLDCRTSKKRGQGMLGLGRLTQLNFGFDIKALSDVDVKDLRKVKMLDLLKYNAGDVRYLPRMFDIQDIRMSKCLRSIYYCQIETSKSLTIAETRGVSVNRTLMNILEHGEDGRSGWLKEVNDITAAIKARSEVIEYESKYKKFLNPGSDTQLAVIFEKILGLACKKRTMGIDGKYSLDKYVLAEFIEEGVELASLILQYREYTDLMSTYIVGVQKRLDYKGILHTDYNSEFTDTGRLSSSDPNLQNWDHGKNAYVRRLIIA